MKYLSFLWIAGFVFLGCSGQTDGQTESVAKLSGTEEPIFSSKNFDVNFPSQLPVETLEKAQSFADHQIGSVLLISLLPECLMVGKEERCYETTVLSSTEGDSLKSEQRTRLDSAKVDADRFGKTETLRQEDLKKLLTVLFAGTKKEAISFCYSPRHAIAIFDTSKEMTGFIEICFECSESIAILQAMKLPDLSEKALNEIGALFLAYGFAEKPTQSD